MKKCLLLILFAVAVVSAVSWPRVAVAQTPYMVAFYNLENLFDLDDDPATNDDEFTPHGDKQWNHYKYHNKLKNLERVFSDMAALQDAYPAVIGVAEVENRSVLEDLASMPKLDAAKYSICHFDSPDERGIDCAFLYRADVFKMEGCENISLIVPDDPQYRTRDLVAMWGNIEGESFYFLVSHWPSRRGGQYATAHLREACARQIKAIKDSILAANSVTKFVVMGDFNDDATDANVVDVMGVKGEVKALDRGDLFNPFNAMSRAGLGTLAYKDEWNMFDNICVTENLLSGSDGDLRLLRVPQSEYYGGIFSRRYMLQQDGQYKGAPLRTFVGKNFQNGYSDHLPIYIYIGR